ncbi:hypothetical protein [Geobacter sp.]|uniref:hypothetical protein n=1 Tax=Geobacter sp. TaxID=46610 RepID=UPI0026256916|nr:hypothetical protein [Geobacter sp.]
MKPRLAVMFATVAVVAGISLHAHAEEQVPAGQKGMPMQMGPDAMQEMMKQMKERMGDDPMMAQCMAMMQTPITPRSPASLLAMKESLKLSDDQVQKLKELEEKTNAEALRLLTEEQRASFTAMTKGWKPMSMMEGMQTMMPRMQKMMGNNCPCPMCRQMMQGK